MEQENSPKRKNSTNPTVISIAEILTRILSPISSMIVGVLIVFFEYTSSGTHLAYDWLLAAVVTLLLAVGTLVLFMKIGLISNWDITDRKQRPKFLGLISLYSIILIFITIRMDYVGAIPVLILFASALIIGTCITLFWKISFHTFAVTLCILLILAKYGDGYMNLLMILPFVTAWTRVVLGKHTMKQALGGIVLGIAVLWIWILLPFDKIPTFFW